jgi:minor extracellular serine protease Vpr
MVGMRFSSVQMKTLVFLTLALELCLQAFAAPAATGRNGGSVTGKTLAKMTIPGTTDLQLIIELSDPGVLEKMKGSGTSQQLEMAGLPSGRNRRVDLQSQEALAYRRQVGRSQETLKSRILQLPGTEVLGTTDVVMNSVIARVPVSRYNAIRQLPGVKKVYFSRPRRMLLDQAALLQNAQALWTAVGGQSNAGQGIKIGLIDSGIDITNAMFSGTGMSTPSGFPKYDTQADRSLTNSKVIAARSYVSLLSSRQSVQTAADEVGHGTFVAGCAAGRQVSAPLATLSGMAPGAWLGSYKVFGTPGINDTTTTAAILAALNDAIADGMDVISLSLGALDYIPPAEDAEAIALEKAVQGGVVVTIAAGNDGSATHTIGSPGTTDDAITVGAVTSAREFAAALHTTDPNLSTIGYAPSADGISVSSNIPYTSVVDVASLDGNGLGCSSFSSGRLSGSIALIQRGTCTFATKVGNASAAGAKAVIVYNNVSPGMISMSVGSANIPAVMISQSDGQSLKRFIDSNPSGAQVAIDNSLSLQSVPTAARVVSSFSSVGPNMDFNIKPDLVAVGENVYSATEKTSSNGIMYDASGYTVSSGTSFATPMVAGAAAALRQAFPSLGPAAIKSLLTTTASRNVTADGTNAANVLQAGGGLLNMGNALAATAVFSPTSLNFGVHSYQGSVTLSAALTIENISSSTDQFTLGVEQVVDGASITFSQNSTGSIPPDAAATVNVTIQVASPNSGGFQGFVTAKSSATSFVYRVPYWAALYVPDSTRVLVVSQSASGAYTNIADALAAAQPGNIVEIQDSGTYSVGASGLIVSTNAQGVPLHGITIRAASGRSPVIDGSALGAGSPANVQIVGLQNVLLKGLTIDGGYTGVQLYQPSTTIPLSATIDQSTISDSTGDSGATGVWIDGGGTIEITHSIVSGSSGTGIVAGLYADGTQLTVLNSTVQSNSSDGLDAIGSNVDIANSIFSGNIGAGVYLDYCSGTVRGSTFSGNQPSRISNGDGLQIADGTVDVRGNLFSSNADGGLALFGGDKTGLGPTVQVLGNTVRGNGYYGIYSNPAISIVADGNLIEDNAGGLSLSATSSALLRNNIVVRSTDSGIGDGVRIGSGSSVRMVNNTVYQNALHGVNLAGGTVSIANTIVASSRGGDLQGVSSGSVNASLISVEPGMTNPGADDFSLAAGSPAIDAGSNSAAGLPFLDYMGRLRASSSTALPGQGTVDIGAEEANSQYPLVYPFVVSGNPAAFGSTFRTGIAFSNPTGSAAQVNLAAYNGSGSLISGLDNPAAEPLSVEGQLAILDYQLFGYDSTASSVASVLASSDSKIVGFDLVCDPDFSLFSTGANASSDAGNDLVFMRHENDANGTANYVVFNPGVNSANITATLFNASGFSSTQTTASIAPKGQAALRFSSAALSSGYLRVQSDRPVSGVEVVGNTNRQAALGAFSPGSQAKLFFPHFAVGGNYTTQVGIVNSGGSAVNLNLTAYDDNGILLGTIHSISLPAGGQLLDSISDLFGISAAGSLQTGYLVAEADQPGIMGFTDYTYNDGTHTSDATIPADSVPSQTLLFSHIAEGVNAGTGVPYRTGIALLNPHGTEATYTIRVYDGAGTLVAQANNTIGPHQKVAKILSYPDAGVGFFAPDMTLGNGHIEVTTDYGLLGLELFFTEDVSQLASVPAQVQ